jgi:hypothetical protein
MTHRIPALALTLTLLLPATASAQDGGINDSGRLLTSTTVGVVLGAGAVLVGVTSTTTGLFASMASDDEEEAAVLELMTNEPAALQAAVSLGAGALVNDLAFILRAPDNSELGRRLRKNRAKALSAIRERDAAAFIAIARPV